MNTLRTFLHRLLGRPASGSDPLHEALEPFRNPEANTLALLRRLVGVLRPKNRRDDHIARYRRMLDRLDADGELRAAFRRHVIHFVAERRLITFFTDSGILPGTGFFSEWGRILGSRLLPEVSDERRLKDCLQLIYDRPNDWQWLEQIPEDCSSRFWNLIATADELHSVSWRPVQEQMLDAVLLLAHRISGLGVDSELMRASSNFDDNLPRFVALSAEALDFVNAYRQALDDPAQSPDDGKQLMVIIDQCMETLQRIRKSARTTGTSLHLSYLLTRSQQSLERLQELTTILLASRQARLDAEAFAACSEFVRTAFLAQTRRNSLGFYLGQLSSLLAVRVTENAARSGEHYICETAADYRHMWWSAGGAGVFIAGMSLLKINVGTLDISLFNTAFLYSMIYGLGFVVIYLLGMTVATKQPAMTAQTLASLLGDLRLNRGADLERLVDVIAAVCRSQLAAIAGNVMVAIPMAIALGYGLTAWFGEPQISRDQAAHLLHDLDIFSWAIPHAAIAGFYLYLSGLINGYFDNRAAYADIGLRVASLRWLKRLLGAGRARKVGAYVEDHLGGIMGNFLFGCMLGSTGIIGIILGLPIDIRHIAFSSANFGYTLVGYGFDLPLAHIAWAAFGFLAFGCTNLLVSFALALRTAMRARGIQFNHGGPLAEALWQRLRQDPRCFVLPPRPLAEQNVAPDGS
ncbi:putative site-specific recombinase [Sterolibacterium denitrificans]|uniref:Site-specific recombinase n=1 Tax=Sterolibacterium denitrificans TaxID=157592 RepID=A0A7Z7HSA7_9PROT|nr:site-specific recombinase [Sterolibacterium denitrificans]SMB29465.1 putative site-specific recombinase [Sterolibacterium denitrificans]